MPPRRISRTGASLCAAPAEAAPPPPARASPELCNKNCRREGHSFTSRLPSLLTKSPLPTHHPPLTRLLTITSGEEGGSWLLPSFGCCDHERPLSLFRDPCISTGLLTSTKPAPSDYD